MGNSPTVDNISEATQLNGENFSYWFTPATPKVKEKTEKEKATIETMNWKANIDCMMLMNVL